MSWQVFADVEKRNSHNGSDGEPEAEILSDQATAGWQPDMLELPVTGLNRGGCETAKSVRESLG